VVDLVPILTRDGYWCKPSIQELTTYTEQELCMVMDFEVGRHGYGKLLWPGPTDVRGLNLDELVDIDKMSVSVKNLEIDEVHGDELPNPLKKKCEVHLRVEAKKLTDPKAVNDKLKAHCEKMGHEFIEYNHVTNMWIFEIY